MTLFASTRNARANAPSAILLPFRDALEACPDVADCLRQHLEAVTYGDAYGWSLASRFHAARVLTRLAAQS